MRHRSIRRASRCTPSLLTLLLTFSLCFAAGIAFAATRLADEGSRAPGTDERQVISGHRVSLTLSAEQ